MNFLGMGPGELMVIMVLALIVFGPQKLPEMGRNFGKAIGEFRRATTSITDEINRELSLEAQPAAHDKKPEPAATAAGSAPASADTTKAPLMLEIKPSARVASEAPADDGADIAAASEDAAMESPAADHPATDIPAEAAPVRATVETSVLGAPEKPVGTVPESAPVESAATEEAPATRPEATA